MDTEICLANSDFSNCLLIFCPEPSLVVPRQLHGSLALVAEAFRHV